MIDQVTADSIVAEARRLLAASREQQLALRLVGGVGVRLSIGPGEEPVLSREYQDIDLITVKGASRSVSQFMEAAGYVSDQSFNVTNGHRRLLFYDVPRNRQVDVFVGTFSMCHTIPMAERLTLLPDSIPLAELLLTKLQIVKINPKDITDVVTLLYHHEVGEDDIQQPSGNQDTGWMINAPRAAQLCAADWGLWRTVKMNVERTTDALTDISLTPPQRELVANRLTRFWSRIDAQPKSAKWKLRNRVGDHLQWYEEPEEVT